MSIGNNIQIYNIESIAKKLEADYHEVTEKIEHMPTRGDYREKILKKYLSELIPKKFEIGTGIVTDIDGTQSKQQDLFIYDAFNSPVFLKDEASVFIPVESVYATIEVKSTLSKDTLKMSIENIRSVKSLKQTQLINSFYIPAYHNFILGSVFAYTSDVSMDALHKSIIEICKGIPVNMWPSMVCVFDKGLLVNVNKTNMRKIEVVPSDSTMWVQIVNNRDVNLYLFYLILQQHLNSTTNFPPDLLKYAEASHKIDSVQTSIHSDLIPEDMTMDFGRATLNAAEIKKMSEAAQKIGKLFKHGIVDGEVLDPGGIETRINEISEEIAPIIQKTLNG